MVALLNAIKAQQAMLAEDEPTVSSGAAGKSVVKDMPQESFLTLLKKAAKSATPSSAADAEAPAAAGTSSTRAAHPPAGAASNKRKWAVLDDEYMMTAKAKDWAKADSEESDAGFSGASSDESDDD